MTRWGLGAAWIAAVLLSGCVSVAEFRKLEREVLTMKRDSTLGRGSQERVADLGAEFEALDARIAELQGRLEVVEHQASRALDEAKAARREAAEGGAATPGAAPAAAGAPGGEEGATAEEVGAYREAYAAWRNGEVEACIDRFRTFLQTWGSSPYADDAAFWLADCHFKQGDYKTAILRFDDVVARYPDGEKAPEALYRQGEALLRLGPGYAKAAGKAFERVVREYPKSPRATEAKRQLELLGPG